MDKEGLPEAGPSGEAIMKKKSGSLAVSIGLLLMAVAWFAVLVIRGDQHFVRWLSSVVLFIVGVTGILGIGRARVKK